MKRHKRDFEGKKTILHLDREGGHVTVHSYQNSPNWIIRMGEFYDDNDT